MANVGIVTDTISCIPENLVKELDIKIVPTGLVIDRKQYKDNELSNDQFWKLFYAAKEHITTVAVNPTDFAEIFKDLAKSTESIICITVSARLSATNNAAVKALELVKEEFPKLNILVIDSTTATGAQGFLVIEAARAAKAGKRLTEIEQQVNAMIPRVKFLVAMDTLKYLIKSGRAPKTAVLGNWMKVKPLIGMVNGSGLVENIGRARGKEKAMQKIVEMMANYLDPVKPVHLMVHYTDDITPALHLKEMITSKFNCQEVYMTPYTPVMASQTGPVVSIAFYT